jgi:putative transposase
MDPDPTAGQGMLLAKHAGTARFAWNWALAERMRRYRENEGPARFTNAVEQQRELNRRKASEFPWMYEVSKCAPQQALRDLDRGFRNFVRARKAGHSCGFPRFKPVVRLAHGGGRAGDPGARRGPGSSASTSGSTLSR